MVGKNSQFFIFLNEKGKHRHSLLIKKFIKWQITPKVHLIQQRIVDDSKWNRNRCIGIF